MLLGLKIKKAIEDARTSPEQVAAHAEMSLTNLYKIYKRDSIDSKYLVKIAEATNKSVDFFLYDDDEPRSGNQVRGIGNAIGAITNQKINTGPGKKDVDTAVEESVIINQLTQQLEACADKVKSLQNEIALKDQIINLKDQLLEQAKK
ncbi:hypothetical protein AHMF7605_10305 [Adhaeribacter arboris]|uniref:HTH cro/C1-type domain-containing protein n=2 Tax=Adhaeribacter arboris TaxID=2072846 RepID=A0A2T2YED8_9BACT|nr:hypothetical protein AHMF7605_10305 [Adhaeribacter arboris]